MIGMVNAGAEVTSDGIDGHGEVLAWQARAHATGRAELARRDFSMHAPRRAALTGGQYSHHINTLPTIKCVR
jgi:hypothetical protein